MSTMTVTALIEMARTEGWTRRKVVRAAKSYWIGASRPEVDAVLTALGMPIVGDATGQRSKGREPSYARLECRRSMAAMDRMRDRMRGE